MKQRIFQLNNQKYQKNYNHAFAIGFAGMVMWMLQDYNILYIMYK